MRKQSMLKVKHKTPCHSLSRTIMTGLLTTLMLFMLTIPGCASIVKDQVNIYLITDESAYKGESNRMFMVPLASQPIIASSDIVTYDSEQHQMELTSSAFAKLKTLEVPVNVGLSFIVCVGIVRVYMGAFWSPLSSSSSDGVIIQRPLLEENNRITIQIGYPTESYFRGSDPRSNTRIIQALKNSGKLK